MQSASMDVDADLREPPLEITSDADEFRAAAPQAAQGVETHGIRREQVGQIDPEAAGCDRADAAQFMHLCRVQSPREVNGTFLRSLYDLNPALHIRA
jgi:hypothetical protein